MINMQKKTVWCLMMMLAAALFLASCVPTEKVCSLDKDCVPAICCHASDTVNRDNAPDCRGILCTMDCVPETLDCGQGQMKCVQDQCRAVFE